MGDTLNRTLNRHSCSDTLTRPASAEMQGLPLLACLNDHIDPQILRKTHSNQRLQGAYPDSITGRLVNRGVVINRLFFLNGEDYR